MANLGSPTAVKNLIDAKLGKIGAEMLTTGNENRFQLAMDDDIGIASQGACEVGVQRHVQGIVTILRDVQHSSAEILRAMHDLAGEYLEYLTNCGVGDGVEAVLDSTSRRDVKFNAHALGTVLQSKLGRKVSTSFH